MRAVIASLVVYARRHPAWATICGGLAILGLGWTIHRAIARRSLEWHLRQAEEMLVRDEFSQAREQIQNALRLDPRSSRAYILLARCARRSGEPSQAQEYLDRAERFDLPIEEAALERMLLALERGDLGKVEQLLIQRLRAGDPASAEILDALVPAYLNVQHHQAAQYCTELALKQNPLQVKALLWHAQIMEKVNRHEDALRDYRQVLAVDPINFWARLSVGEVLLLHNHAAEALQEFEALRERHPDNPAVLLGLACCQRRMARLDEARRLLDRLQASNPNYPPIASELGQLALDQGELPEAKKRLKQALDFNPSDRPLIYALARCAQLQGEKVEADRLMARWNQVENEFNRLREISAKTFKQPNAPAERTEAGLICLRLGKTAEAIGWLQGALKDDPEYEPARLALARIREKDNLAPPALYRGRGVLSNK